MFAGCIEKKANKVTLGSILLDQMNKGVLNKFPSKNKTFWQGDFAENYSVTIIEQSIYENECQQIERVEDVLVVGWLRLDNAEELRGSLEVHNNATNRQLIAAAYAKWGDKLCQHLYGDFSFVVMDLKKQKCLLCRDHMGVRPLYYYQDADILVFATTLAVFSGISALNLTLSEEYIARYCMSAASDWTLTVYEKVFSLAPANIAQFSVSTFTLDVHSYFSFDQDVKLSLNSEYEYIERYKDILDEAVRCRVVDVSGALASESSGGIDSSTVTAIAAKYLPSPEKNLYAYGFVTEVEEEACILMMSEYLKLKNTHLFKMDADEAKVIDQALKDFEGTLAKPITASIATVHTPVYQKAKADGATILLSGFGGDEFVTIYAATARVELFKNRQWRQWFNLFKGNDLTKKLRAFKWFVRLFVKKNTFETAQALLRMKNEFLKNKVIKQNICDRFKIPQILTERSSYDAGCQSVNEFSLNNRWSPEMVARLEDCSLAAAMQGLEYRWPLLDVRLINFFLSVPSQYKLNNGLPRYLHRKAIQGIVPEHLIWKDKSMGGPLTSKNHQSQPTEMNEMFDIETVEFGKLHPNIQAVIDEEKWTFVVDQISQLNNDSSEEGNVLFVEKILPIIQPVISLSEWINNAQSQADKRAKKA